MPTTARSRLGRVSPSGVGGGDLAMGASIQHTTRYLPSDANAATRSASGPYAATAGPHSTSAADSPESVPSQSLDTRPGCPDGVVADRAPIARSPSAAGIRNRAGPRAARQCDSSASALDRPTRLRDAEVGSSNLPHPTPTRGPAHRPSPPFSAGSCRSPVGGSAPRFPRGDPSMNLAPMASAAARCCSVTTWA
jgi:hypothetical protein